jgi:hypothetical protein
MQVLVIRKEKGAVPFYLPIDFLGALNGFVTNNLPDFARILGFSTSSTSL